MGRYLNEFASTIPAIQGKQIFELLNIAKDTGEIRTLEEFQQRLQELTETLRATDPQPTFELFKAMVGKSIRSDAFNTMTKAAINDVETGFKEIQNIAEVLQIHKTLINENILNNLKFAINDLETKIAVQEFLNNDRSGFTLAQFNTFKQNQTLSTKRSDIIAGDTFVDNQTGLPVSSAFDTVIDVVGEKLIMAPKRTKYISIRNAKPLFDSETRITELDIDFPGSEVRNIIDNQTGTYWIYQIFLGSSDRSGIVSKLELELLGYQDVNFIEFEPASFSPFTLEKIIYTDVNTENQILDVDEITINGKTRIDFSTVTTKKLTFHFRQKDYQHIQYSFNQNSNMWERAIAQDSMTLNDIDKTLVNDELFQTLNAQQLKELNDITDQTTYQNVNMYEYLIGFDNIKIGFTEYEDKSVFVSSSLEGNKIGILGLKTAENRLSNNDIPFTSFEYNIFKQNLASDDSFVDSEKFSIIPSGQTNILHERLMLNEHTDVSNDTGSLRFYPEGDTETQRALNVIVYKDFNITPLTNGLDYIITDNSALVPKEYKIKMTSPNVTSIYTISYLPAYSGASAGTEIWLNKQRTMKFKQGNIIDFTNERPNAVVAYSRVYLTILMRINSVDDTKTPSIEEYRLLVGTINKEKYIE